MKGYNPHNQQGFTLIETVVAILILSMTVGVLLTLTAGGVFSVRYARNQIVADNLNQEALEYIRNRRDSAKEQGVTWDTWLTTLNVRTNGIPQPLSTPFGCFDQAKGCLIDPYTTDPNIWEYNATGSCTSQSGTGCPYLWFYPANGFYTYPSRTHAMVSGNPVITTYIRRVRVERDSTQEIITVTVTTTWKNGTANKSSSQSMVLSNW